MGSKGSSTVPAPASSQYGAQDHRRADPRGALAPESMRVLDIDLSPVFAPLLKPARYKGAWGGRGSGKSHFFAELLIATSITKRLDAVCVRENQKSLAQSVKKLLELKIQKMK